MIKIIYRSEMVAIPPLHRTAIILTKAIMSLLAHLIQGNLRRIFIRTHFSLSILPNKSVTAPFATPRTLMLFLIIPA